MSTAGASEVKRVDARAGAEAALLVMLSALSGASLCRREAWMPTVLDRNPYNIWTGKGSLTNEELVVAKVNRILETHQPAPLAGVAEARIEAILAEAEAREKQV